MPLNNSLKNFDQIISKVQTGEKTFNSFVKPLLKETINYNRITSFFTPKIIKSKFEELAQSFKKGGSVKLIIGVHESEKLIPLLNRIDNDNRESYFKEVVQNIITNGMIESIDLFEDHESFLSVLAELIDQKFIQIKIAALRGDYEYYLSNNSWPKDDGIFHPKIGIFKDETDTVVMMGSINSTSKGYGSNVEDATFMGSWFAEDAVNHYESIFKKLWDGEHPDAITLNFSSEIKIIAKKIRESSKLLKYLNVQPTNENFSYNHFIQYINETPLMFDNSFEKIRILPHQKEVYNAALSRYPIRALIADEVGLGKTIEAGAIIKYCKKFLNVKRTAFLVPASLMFQWQDELFKHFNIKAYVYNHSSRSLIFKNRSNSIDEISLSDGDPIYSSQVENVIFSWHFLRLNDEWVNKLSEDEKVDFITVDESHWARMTRTYSNKVEETRLYTFLFNLLKKTKHYLLLTATPFQTDSLDYKSMLNLLMKTEDTDISSLDRIAQLNRNRQLNNQQKLDGVTELIDNLDFYQTSSMPKKNIRDDIPSIIDWYSDELYLKNNPTSIYTIRNTRASLKLKGYKFPEVEINSEPIELEAPQKKIFEYLNDYLDSFLCQFEESFKRTNIGQLKVIYRQRIVSSFKACNDTLNNRAEILKEYISQGFYINEQSIIDELNEDGEFLDSLKVELTEEQIQKAKSEISFIEEIQYNISKIYGEEKTLKDPKIEKLMTLINSHLLNDDKIIVFSKYTSTTDYIVKILNEQNNLNYGRFQGDCKQIYIDGILSDVDRETFGNQFKKGSVPLIICSDAASEGLNLQTANILINIDVPWNPAKLLQRFGRIDRFGQKSENLFFYNLFYPSTIEDRMYSRLHNRNNDFRELLGDTPDITSYDHFEYLENNEFIENRESQDIVFKNSLINLSSEKDKPICENLLTRLKKLDGVEVSNSNINYENNNFEYSTDFINQNYLDINHPSLLQIANVKYKVTHKLFKLINHEKTLLSYCIEHKDLIYPMFELDKFLDYFISGNSWEINKSSISFRKTSISEDFLNIIKNQKNNLINHNKIKFNNECDLYSSIKIVQTSISIECKINL